MDEDAAPAGGGGVAHGVEGIPDDVGDGGSGLFGDGPVEVDGADVDGAAIPCVLGDFLGIHEEEASGLLDAGAVFVNGLEADLG